MSLFTFFNLSRREILRSLLQLRIFYEATWYMARTSCQWRFVPSYYGDWRALHNRFFRWSRKGVWERLLENLKIEPDLESVMIDATIVRAHACASGYKKDSLFHDEVSTSTG